MQLPRTYRSLPRPSSPLDAKASAVCLIAFDLNNNSYLRVHAMWPHSTVLIPHTGPHACAPGLTPSVQRLSKSNSSRRSCREKRQEMRRESYESAGDTRGLSLTGKPATTRRSRKEVIQPQVPLRLPCYDFAPVTELTFDGCLSCELAHRLQVPPASMA